MDPATRYRLIELLWSGLNAHGLRELARTVSSTKDQPLLDMLDVLSRVEREPGLPADAHRLVAMCKQALTGKITEDGFARAVQRAHGLL